MAARHDLNKLVSITPSRGYVRVRMPGKPLSKKSDYRHYFERIVPANQQARPVTLKLDCSGRFQIKNTRRTRRRLAHQLRRPGSLLRSGRVVHRRLRHERKYSQCAGRHLPASAQTTMLGSRVATRVPESWRDLYSSTPRHSHAATQRTPRVPLLRPMRTRLSRRR
jgi:hypothetical protein